ncbi:HS12B-like protein [Mya arenaria]|uniref:HS12B-like protein n=1 Tax=Mya arenaria TaxID=6604 RepID=A0ABY7DRV8_MYAAR|nr:HS12B-like protein [Mya arenaria]
MKVTNREEVRTSINQKPEGLSPMSKVYLQEKEIGVEDLMLCNVYHDSPERSISDQVTYVPGRIHLHPLSAPSIEEETNEDAPKRSIAGPVDYVPGRNHPAPTLEEETICSKTIISIDMRLMSTGGIQHMMCLMSIGGIQHMVPTVVLFDQNKTFNSFGYEAQKKYKELLKLDNHREWYLFKEFKMTLFQTNELKENTPVKDFQERKEMPAIDIFSNAIRYIKEKLLEHLGKQESGICDRDIHWVLTVPAIWNDAAKQFMRTSATKVTAGILNEMLSIALEPEAASVYCRETFHYLGNLGTRYILLDLGVLCPGGTADITCHKVVDGGLKELREPEGGRFGGTNVDKSFIKQLENIFGSKAVKKFKENDLNGFWDMMADFELYKRTFDGTEQLRVKLPARLNQLYNEQKGIDDTLGITITRDKMCISKSIGQRIFNETIDLVIEEMQILLKALKLLGSVDYIVLVGGFSESKYLQTRMKAEFGIKVVAPAEPRTAVMKGAVLFGQNPAAIKARVSKYTYGIATMIRFEPGLHSEKKRMMIRGRAYCDDIFEKHVTIGQEITVGQTMKECTYHPTLSNQAHAVLQVFASSKENPKYVTDEDCRQVGLVLVEMDTGGNRNFELKVKLIFGGTEIQVEVRDGHGILIKKAEMNFLV